MTVKIQTGTMDSIPYILLDKSSLNKLRTRYEEAVKDGEKVFALSINGIEREFVTSDAKIIIQEAGIRIL